MVKIAKLRGFAKRKRGVLKESIERRPRRKVFQVGDAITKISVRMMTLDLLPKVPLSRASDCVCLALFMATLVRRKWKLCIIAVFFLCAHHIRTPSLMAKLLEKSSQKVFQRTSEAILYLDDLLRQPPFKQQTSGEPYWIAYARLHFGAQKFREWTSSDEELNLCNAVRQLCSVACSKCSVLDCVTGLQSLPHAASYAYDIRRLWLTSIELCHSWKVVHIAKVCPRVRRLPDDTEELVCKHMSPQVKILFDLFNHVDAWKKICIKVGGRNVALQSGSKALLCCEVQGFLGNLGHVPTQGSSKHLNLIEYAAGCNLQMLRALQNYLEGLEKRPDVAKKLGESRRECVEVNKFFPRAAKLDHSSFAAKNFCANLPKELKCAGE